MKKNVPFIWDVSLFNFPDKNVINEKFQRKTLWTIIFFKIKKELSNKVINISS